MNDKQRRRLEEAAQSIDAARAIVEDVQTEELDKLDNLPDGLRWSGRYDDMEETANNLGEIADELESVSDSLSEIFPSKPSK